MLEEFRNYQRARVELAPGVNAVVGRNAQGKTNLLEAIYCLSGLGSPRGLDANLVREGAERALLHARIAHKSRSLELDLELQPGRGTRSLVNKTPVSASRGLAGVFVSVFFGPDDLALIKGAPDGRRRFVDDLVVKLRPARLGLRRQWERVLKQRNALLRSWPRAPGEAATVQETLKVWDDAFARTGAGLTLARLETLAALGPHAAKRYETVAGSGRCELAYASSWLDAEVCDQALVTPADVTEENIRQALAARLEELRDRELERGMSLAGPQRDDVLVLLTSERGETFEARSHASQGDQRTAALALKLAEHDLLADALGEPPVLLLDDVFSELDSARRAWLAEAVRGGGQTVVTSAEPGVVEAMEPEKVIEVVGGALGTGG